MLRPSAFILRRERVAVNLLTDSGSASVPKPAESVTSMRSVFHAC